MECDFDQSAVNVHGLKWKENITTVSSDTNVGDVTVDEIHRMIQFDAHNLKKEIFPTLCSPG